MHHPKRPLIIQGGMGAGVSGYTLARAVSITGQLGVVSGTALDVILARRLQLGDPCGSIRRALEHFPIPDIAKRIYLKYFVEGGKPADKPFKAKPMPSEKPSKHLEELLVVSNFVEVFLAREGHDNPVGINYLEKIQAPTLPSIYGAMLAGVTYILMGAGIPRAIPGILDRFSRGETAEMRLEVKGAERGESYVTRFDPAAFMGQPVPELHRPDFLAIVSSATLASMLARKASGKVNGFVIEYPTAGGHNAPPRGAMQLSVEGEPIYSDRDVPDLKAIKALGLPYWLAGSYALPGKLEEALEQGAAGIQVGTAFAYCEESGITPEIKAKVLSLSVQGKASIFTDPVASPTGFPFKVVQLDDTISNHNLYQSRTRICDLGYLRHAYKKPEGNIGWRCPSEPVDDYVRKCGDIEDTNERKCVCNGLMANIGMAQVKSDGSCELPFITSGDDVVNIARYLKPGKKTYTAAEVIDSLLAQSPQGAPLSTPHSIA